MFQQSQTEDSIVNRRPPPPPPVPVKCPRNRGRPPVCPGVILIFEGIPKTKEVSYFESFVSSFLPRDSLIISLLLVQLAPSPSQTLASPGLSPSLSASY